MVGYYLNYRNAVYMFHLQSLYQLVGGKIKIYIIDDVLLKEIREVFF